MARLALSTVSDNRERQDLVENFMLVKDTATIGVEVPVWFWKKKLVDNYFEFEPAKVEVKWS